MFTRNQSKKTLFVATFLYNLYYIVLSNVVVANSLAPTMLKNSYLLVVILINNFSQLSATSVYKSPQLKAPSVLNVFASKPLGILYF